MNRELAVCLIILRRTPDAKPNSVSCRAVSPPAFSLLLLMTTQHQEKSPRASGHVLEQTGLSSAWAEMPREELATCGCVTSVVAGIVESDDRFLERQVRHSIVRLDQLARHVDPCFESDSDSARDAAFLEAIRLSVHSICTPLEQFDENIQTKVWRAVEHSIVYNSIERHRAYALDGRDDLGSTLFYMIPLLNLLAPDQDRPILSTILISIGNLVQLLDDWVDMEDDVMHSNETPVTMRYHLVGESIHEDIINGIEKRLKLVVESVRDWRYEANLTPYVSTWVQFIRRCDHKRRMGEGDLGELKRYVKYERPQVLCYLPP